MVQVTPKTEKHKGCLIYFGFNEDQEYDLKEMPIVLAYNGIDHFTPTVLLKPNMMVGIDNMCELLDKCTKLSIDLSEASNNPKVNKVFNSIKKKIKHISDQAVNVFKEVIPSDDEEGVLDENAEKRTKLETRTKKTTMTDSYCACGLEFDSPQLAYENKQDVHADNQWYCSLGDECEKGDLKYGSDKALKRHYRTEHLGEKLHWCLYCETGSNEKKSILPHMFKSDSVKKKFKCSKPEGCTRVFPSMSHLNKHEKYCGDVKSHEC